MKISFVIPAYNEENYLGRCLDSVFSAIKNCPYSTEVIVVNNASTDRTKQIALQYPDVRLIEEPRKGLTKARQAGFCASSGNLVANIDADTILPKDWIEKIVNQFQKNQNLVLISGPQIYYDLPFYQRWLTRAFYIIVLFVYFLNRYIFRIASVVQGGNFVVKKSALEEIGGFNLKIDFYGEDADLAKRLFKTGQIKFSLRIPILASGRRLQKQGIIKTGLLYSLNYFGIILFRKTFQFPNWKRWCQARSAKKFFLNFRNL